MDAKIHVSRLGGTATVPPSKSAAHRAVLCAALAEGTSHITNIEYSKDIRATLGAAAQLGAKITEEAHSVTIKGHGTAGGFVTVTRPVFCNESGSTLRFMIPLFSLTAQKVRFTGAGGCLTARRPSTRCCLSARACNLSRRPRHHDLWTAASRRVYPARDVSSQFISGLLFAAPLMESESSIEVLAPYESRSYVDMTVDAMQQFGVKVTSRARKNRQCDVPRGRAAAVYGQ